MIINAIYLFLILTVLFGGFGIAFKRKKYMRLGIVSIAIVFLLAAFRLADKIPFSII